MSKRAIAMIICLALTIPTTVFGSIAYLNDIEGVVNTMTVGKVDIVVDEGKVNKEGFILGEDGKPVTNSEGKKIKVGADGFVVDEDGKPVTTPEADGSKKVFADESGYLVAEDGYIVDADGKYVVSGGNKAVVADGVGVYVDGNGVLIETADNKITAAGGKLTDKDGSELGFDAAGNIVNEDGDVVVSADELAGKTVPPTQGRDEEGNNYRLVPGKTYQKDPAVKVSFGSEDSYVRMLVTFSKYSKLTALIENFDYTKLGIVLNAGWAPHGDPAVKSDPENGVDTVTYEFRYEKIVSGGEEIPAVFSKITVPSGLTGADLEEINGMTITAIGHAMQADGFAGAAAAWEAFGSGN